MELEFLKCQKCWIGLILWVPFGGGGIGGEAPPICMNCGINCDLLELDEVLNVLAMWVCSDSPKNLETCTTYYII